MIERLENPAAASEWCRERREAGRSIGFVPTMGALHEGHLSLVRAAKQEADIVVVSVFVNPLQFDEPGDLERYPRDFDGDASALESAGADMVFTGTLEGFFPGELVNGDLPAEKRLDPGPASKGLEGAFRSGHFDGVATIVDRLFDVVQPDVAHFGAKDFQQVLVVKHLAKSRGNPRIEVGATLREPDGVAMSSRNALLEPSFRGAAPAIHRALHGARDAWRVEGVRDAEELSARVRSGLEGSGLEIEYAEVRDPEKWTEHSPSGDLERAVGLVAVRAGAVRLIDNLMLS